MGRLRAAHSLVKLMCKETPMRHEIVAAAFLTVSLVMAAPASQAGKTLNFDDDTVRTNYSLGYQIGGDFKRQKIEMHPEAIVQGIADALAGTEAQMDEEEMQATLVALKRKVTQQERQEKQQREVMLLEEGKAYMAANAEKPGVITTDSGLQYRIVKEGSGAQPGATDRVTVNYRGSLPDGVEFDSGDDVSFPLNGVIKGWGEGMQLVREGGKIELVVPPNLAYNNRGPLAHRTLIFEVELIKTEPPEGD